MRTAIALAGLTPLVLACAIAARAAEPPPPDVMKIVERFVADSSGIVVSLQSVVSDQASGGRTKRSVQELGVIEQNRATVAVRMHRIVNGAEVAGADELAKTQASLDAQYAGPPKITTRFAMPYYPESAADYTFTAPQPCADCSVAGARSVDFASTVIDARHVHGAMAFDPATARLLKLTFVPNVLPEPANAGSLTYTFGAYDDGSYGVVRVVEHYSGESLGITGTVDRTTTVLRARHVPSLDDARRAL